MSRYKSRVSESSIGSVLAPTHGVRDEMRRKGVAPRDHAKANVRALREAQRMNRMKADADWEAGATDSFKMKKFQGVKSRVKMDGKATARADPGTAPAPKKFIKKGEKSMRKMETVSKPGEAPRSSFRRPSGSRKEAVPRADEVLPIAPRSDRNFVSSNRRELDGAKPTVRADGKDEETVKPRNYGKVPKYLQERKAAAADAEARRRAAAGDDACPPGMRLMPESERVDTLRVLRASQDEVKQMLMKMPLVVETAGQVRRKNALEAKLREVEDAVRIFDRPKVFVQDD